MDLRDLYYFQTIAELGHMGQAAEQLHRTQPALSKCLQRLEEELGAQLFERVGRRIHLTAMGSLLLERTRHLRQSMEDTSRELSDFAKGVIGHVRLGSAATTAEFLLPGVTEALLKNAPSVSMELQIGMNDVLHTHLKNGQLDLLIGPLVGEREGIKAHPIADDHVVVVASHGHPVFQQAFDLQSLAQHHWILPAKTVATRQWLEERMTQLRLPRPVVQIETNSISLLPSLIDRTGLLSFIARRNLADGRLGAQLREVPCAELTMTRHFGVSYRATGYLSPAAECLLDLLKMRGAALME